MAARFLRSKLSERIFTHAVEGARIMPHGRLMKGLPPLASEATKIAPMARHSTIGSTMAIKNLTFQSFRSKVPESTSFGFVPNANNLLYNDGGYNLRSSFKGKSGPILIHGRNFSNNIPKKMDSDNKGSSRPGTENSFRVKGDSDSDSLRSRYELTAKIVKVYAAVLCSTNCFAFYYYLWDSLCSHPSHFFFTVPWHMWSLFLVGNFLVLGGPARLSYFEAMFYCMLLTPYHSYMWLPVFSNLS